MKDLGNIKMIIGWEILQDVQVGTLKIDQKTYIQDLFEVKKMSLYHLMVFSMKAGSSISLNQANDYIPANLVTYK